MSEATDILYSVLTDRPDERLDTYFPCIPLNWPGLPLPGPNFVMAAEHLGNAPVAFEGTGSQRSLAEVNRNLEYLYRRALYDENFTLSVNVKGEQRAARVVPGHVWGTAVTGCLGGPRPARVMVIGKNPGPEEVQAGRNFVGPTSEELIRSLTSLGIDYGVITSWYVTNLVKWPQLDRQSSALPQPQIRDCLLLLAQEIRLVRPDFILCLGSDASKALLGTSYSVESMIGRVVDYEYSWPQIASDPAGSKVAKVMTALHPAAVYRKPELSDAFEAQLVLFWQLTNGVDIGAAERDIDHEDVYTERKLKQIVDEMLADQRPDAAFMAFDAEWHGDAPEEPGAYIRTIQFSNKDKWARCVVLRHQGGAPCFKPSIEAAMNQLRRLCFTPRPAHQPVRIGGHFFRADLPWLIHAGLDLRAAYAPHPNPLVRDQGGWDTGLGYHAYNETAMFGLDAAAIRMTTAPRYDVALVNWRKAYCARHKLKPTELEGYGECPSITLHPYGSYDADVTRRIAIRLFVGPTALVFNDWNGRDCWMAFWTSHSASLAFLEMEMTGFCVDRKRADEISTRFMAGVERLTNQLRELINWPEFNPNSDAHCRALLFGDSFGTKKHPITKEPIAVRPPTAKTLGLTPVKSTGKRPQDWQNLIRRNMTAGQNPSCDKEVLGILGQQAPEARMLRDLKFLMQVLKSSLRPPMTHADGTIVTDEDGNFEYEKGLLGSIQSDGCVHTHLFQTKETGRASSARPPLQNLCYDEKTEVYTRDGWLSLPEAIQRGCTEVLEFDEESRTVRFGLVTGHTVQPYEGEMLLFQNNSTDLLITPNHRCLTIRGRDYTEEIAEDLRDRGRNAQWGQVHAAPYDDGFTTWSPDFCHVFMVNYLYGQKRDNGDIAVYMRVDTNYVMERLLKAIEEAGFNYRKPFSANSKTHTLELYNTGRFLSGLPEPTHLDTATLENLVQSYLLFSLDAKHGAWRSTNLPPDKAEWLQNLFILSGRQARIQPREKLKEGDPDTTTMICYPKRIGDTQFRGNGVSSVEFQGTVYCLTVPSGWLLVRRNGKVVVSGNSKRREDDYARILTKDIHVNPVRSILCVPPGYVGIEADLKAAEVAVTAWLSQDTTMIDHTTRSNLPENNPDYYDIHARMACQAFHLSCPPTKKGLKDAGVPGFRVAAKAIIFGTPYGRGPDAICRQLSEEGVQTTVDQCTRLQETYFETYPRVYDLFEEAKRRSQQERWLCNPYGRYRRFLPAAEHSVISEQERQAMNYPIQSSVADAVSLALRNLYYYRLQYTPDQLDYRIMLQIHDAVVLLVPIRFAAKVYHEVLPACMERGVEFWPAYLDGTRMPLTAPYYFGSDRECFINWGEKLTPEKALSVGLAAELAHQD